MGRGKPTLIVDGPNIVMRAVKASERSFLHHDGEPTGPLLLSINMLTRAVRENDPGRVVVCFDGGRSRFRTALFPQYKEGRSDRPADEKGPFSQFKTFLTLSGIHHSEIVGWEADDLIAGYVALSKDTTRTVIFSGDKDMLQLLDTNVVQIRPTGVGGDEWTARRVKDEYGVPARRFGEYLALVGDPGDGVPGVKGYGPKKTAALIEAHPTWPEVVSALPEEHWEMARVCREIVDLRDTPLRMRREGIYMAPAPHFHTDRLESTKVDVVAFLDSYGLESIAQKALSDTLWTRCP